MSSIIRDPELDALNRIAGVYLLRYMATNCGHDKTDERYLSALGNALKGLEEEWAKSVKLEAR